MKKKGESIARPYKPFCQTAKFLLSPVTLLHQLPHLTTLSIRERSSAITFSLTSTNEFSALTKICLISSSVRCFVLHGLEIIAALCFCKKESFDLLFLVILKRFALHRKPNKLYWFQKEGVWSSCQLSPLK